MKKKETKKNKGFTLIEIIVAIAIFAVSMTAITQILSVTALTSKNEKMRTAVWSHSRSALQILKAGGKNGLEDLYKSYGITPSILNNKDKDGNFSIYTYFDDSDELKANIGDINHYIYSNTNCKLIPNTDASVGLFSDLKSKNSNNKRYGCYIRIKKIDTSTLAPDFEIYQIYVRAWDIKAGSDINSYEYVDLGR